MTAAASLFADLPTNLSEEVFTTLIDTDGVTIERIVSHGQASPEGFWYDQPRREWVVVLSGWTRLRFEDGDVELAPRETSSTSRRHKRHPRRMDFRGGRADDLALAVHFGPEER